MEVSRNIKENAHWDNVTRSSFEEDTHLIPGKLLNGTQSRVRELNIDKLLVVVELVLCGQIKERVGRKAGSHLIITRCPAEPLALLLPFQLFFFNFSCTRTLHSLTGKKETVDGLTDFPYSPHLISSLSFDSILINFSLILICHTYTS